MVFMNSLRMLTDLSCYFYFAEFAAVLMGGKTILLEMILLSFLYGLLAHMKKRTGYRALAFVPCLFLFLPKTFGMTMANRMWLLPAIIYVIYLLWKEAEILSWGRQVDLFSVCWKIFLGVGVCICLSGNYNLFAKTSLPMMIVFLVTSILFMRMLRHDSKVYLNRQFQMKNMIFLIGLLLVTWMLSQKAVFVLAGKVFSYIYSGLILPILNLFVICLMFVIRLAYFLFSWIKLGQFPTEQEGVEALPGINPFADKEDVLVNGSRGFENFLTVFMIIVLLLLAFWLFKRMATGWKSEENRTSGELVFRDSIKESGKKKKTFLTVHQVRRQYQKLLKLCQERGIRINLSDTSEDIMNKGVEKQFSQEILEEMREIYIRARYNNEATRSDLKKMKQMNQQLK